MTAALVTFSLVLRSLGQAPVNASSLFLPDLQNKQKMHKCIGQFKSKLFKGQPYTEQEARSGRSLQAGWGRRLKQLRS